MRTAYCPPHIQRGFTLAELAISMIIIALLIGGLLGPIGRQVDQSRVNTTQRQLDDIKESLLGYAVVHRRLPCPDLDGDGVENRVASGVCGTAAGTIVLLGTLPWATLNVPEADAWNTRFGYSVSNEFSVAASPSPPSGVLWGLSFPAATSGIIVINQRNANKSTTFLARGAAVTDPPGAAAIIWSFGKNAYGGTQAGGVARALAPLVNVDEIANATANPNIPANNAGTAGFPFIVRTPTDAATPCSDTAGTNQMCEFDDILLWLSSHTVISRMVVAGRMP